MLAADRRQTSLLDRWLLSLAYEMVGTFNDSISSREFGPYRLIKVLGEGGMGVVWLAERSDAGNRVAIKFLPHAALPKQYGTSEFPACAFYAGASNV